MDYEILGRFLLAALWGGIVGAEREYRSKSAGFRTMIMISMGSCFFTMMSVLIGGENNADRIASNILTGIGFLGAGVIFRGENRVNGITTAATIWAVAAVGMGIGAGHYFASASASVLILLVLAVLPYIENVIDKFNQSKVYSIQMDFKENSRLPFEKLFKEYNLKFRLIKEIKEGNSLSATWQVHGHAIKHGQCIAAIMKEEMVKRFEY
jgi:putative Mg2+ transporter-C (MgtC) family protein